MEKLYPSKYCYIFHISQDVNTNYFHEIIKNTTNQSTDSQADTRTGTGCAHSSDPNEMLHSPVMIPRTQLPRSARQQLRHARRHAATIRGNRVLRGISERGWAAVGLRRQGEEQLLELTHEGAGQPVVVAAIRIQEREHIPTLMVR